MKKRFFIAIFLGTIAFLFLAFFHFNNDVSAKELEISKLINREMVVISNENVYNLNLLQTFYENSLWGNEDTINLIVNPYTRNERNFILP